VFRNAAFDIGGVSMVRAIIDWFATMGFDGLRMVILEIAPLVILVIELIRFIKFYLGPKKE
jgi:hypothetical protein